MVSVFLPTSRVFTSGYVNTETILHFFYKITNERGTKTVFTYAHVKWFYGQSERAYYLNYFIKPILTCFCVLLSNAICLLILIFSTLCVVHDLIFQHKLSRRRLEITLVYLVSHASAQAQNPQRRR